MNIVDSSGWLEYFTNGKNADFFAPAIEKTTQLLVPTVILTEIFKKVLTTNGEDEALYIIAQLQQGEVVYLTTEIALNAARFGFLHKLPLADSIIYATAKMYNASIYTQDADFKGLEKVFYIKK
ncbi:MAG: twitching motility protein PilT [Ignavibacteria bacterium GWB2_35_12]|nr:MAG: twitching motility protein PilT [Ignavibacteria bacterium GWA2_35_8]OGU41291.1 MAG: twitching motility protein PilT [Ignavibacteria bacterium GWB2_35_12]OGU94770.1 MAG: twitching motility protein PilT [Ignavibacteria bacterium RIFOXYA2_FULL_35_10]OGV23936.1 MAG: twitching motility protein PilT [Ignavibacteria bacterium RIFOXYC2_FULL_35_21]